MADTEGPADKVPEGVDLLAIVKNERERSVGFHLDALLTENRERALNYYKGLMPDVPNLTNRSKAVSTDLADTVETLMPDLMDIFTGGDDVVSFIPQGKQDETQAQQETDYLHHVFFEDNNGFLILNTMIKDSLLLKTGVVKWWWDDAPEVEGETFEGKTLIEMALASQDGEISDLEFNGEPYEIGSELPAGGDTEEGWSFTIKAEGPDGKVCAQAFAADDFTVAKDTVVLKEATYCAFRSRPRAQKLKADGYKHADVDKLPVHSFTENDQTNRARDTAGENTYAIGGDGANRDLRTVEIVEHYIRVLGDDDKLELWRVVTGANETILLDQEKVDRLDIAAITPFLTPHRFYGESLADKVMEPQRIKTALLRGQLDSIYFSLNQRHYVDTTCIDTFTISDLLDNRPGVPVRGKGPNGVTPLQSVQSNTDYMAALEYMSTVVEQRTGVVRNAQGLNPDTLHDTMGGALALMSMAQRRTRMIARILAETGIKDLFLGIHATIRKHATKKAETKLKGNWTVVDPTEWAERNEMKIEIGRGGVEQAGMALKQVLDQQQKLSEGPGASLVTPTNAYQALIDAARAMGLKSPEEYFTNPANAPPQQPKPNPDMLKLQNEAQVGQARAKQDQDKLQADTQNAAADRQQEMQLAQMKDQREQQALAAEHQRELAKISSDMELKKAELALKQQEQADKAAFERQRLEAETRVKLAEMQVRSSTSIEVAEIGAGAKSQQTHADLAIQASESADAHAHAHADRQHEAGMAVLGHALSEHSKTTDPQPEPRAE